MRRGPSHFHPRSNKETRSLESHEGERYFLGTLKRRLEVVEARMKRAPSTAASTVASIMFATALASTLESYLVSLLFDLCLLYTSPSPRD